MCIGDPFISSVDELFNNSAFILNPVLDYEALNAENGNNLPYGRFQIKEPFHENFYLYNMESLLKNYDLKIASYSLRPVQQSYKYVKECVSEEIMGSNQLLSDFLHYFSESFECDYGSLKSLVGQRRECFNVDPFLPICKLANEILVKDKEKFYTITFLNFVITSDMYFSYRFNQAADIRNRKHFHPLLGNKPVVTQTSAVLAIPGKIEINESLNNVPSKRKSVGPPVRNINNDRLQSRNHNHSAITNRMILFNDNELAFLTDTHVLNSSEAKYSDDAINHKKPSSQIKRRLNAKFNKRFNSHHSESNSDSVSDISVLSQANSLASSKFTVQHTHENCT